MFVYEIERIEELMQIYKDFCVKYELELNLWLDGDYEKLVPRIFLQMRAMRRFVSYLHYALDNDMYPNDIRVLEPRILKEASEIYRKIWDEYSPMFNPISNKIIQHLIEEVGKYNVDRHNLRDGIWEEADYWNFRTLDSLMNTLCLICEEELRDPYTAYDTTEDKGKEEEEVECTWMYDDYLYEDITPDVEPPLWGDHPLI